MESKPGDVEGLAQNTTNAIEKEELQAAKFLKPDPAPQEDAPDPDEDDLDDLDGLQPLHPQKSLH
jgi:hypothetical protein